MGRVRAAKRNAPSGRPPLRRSRLLLGAWLLLALALSPALAQSDKIASDLLDVLQYVAVQERAGVPLSEISLPPQISIDSERRIQVVLSLIAISPETLQGLREHGVHVEGQVVAETLVQARIPLDRVEEVAQLPFVRLIRLPGYGRLNFQGGARTEGDALIKADLVRQRLGVDGTGIRVGVISDGIAGLPLAVMAGTLPPTELIRDDSGFIVATTGGVTGRSFRADGSLQGSLDSPAPEGTALLEIIHAIAPGAQLFFAAISTDVEFVNAVTWLAEEAGGPDARRGTAGGVDIIVNDFVFFTSGPYDGTSFVSRAATAAVAEGVAVFTAAGNTALQHYQGRFFHPDGTTFHHFTRDDQGLRITVGQFATVILQWNDPWTGSSNDYNLRVFDTQGNPLTQGVFGGRDQQTGTQPPIEVLTIVNFGVSSRTVELRIENVGGRAAPRDLQLFVFFTPVPIEHNVPSGSVGSPADAQGVLTVGAVNVATPDRIERFSAQGPTTDGRLKPELVAPDGVSSTIYGSRGFFGTSAAAPHAAAVAALLLSRDRRLSPPQLARELEVTATDLGDPGPDPVFGFGLVDALAAATLPQVHLTLNGFSYEPGFPGSDTLILDVFLRAGTTLNIGDAYLVGLGPTGDILSLVLQPDGSLRLVTGLVPLQRSFSVFDRNGSVFSYTFSGSEPRGAYLVVGALVLPGRDPRDMSNWIIFDIAEFTLKL